MSRQSSNVTKIFVSAEIVVFVVRKNPFPQRFRGSHLNISDVKKLKFSWISAKIFLPCKYFRKSNLICVSCRRQFLTFFCKNLKKPFAPFAKKFCEYFYKKSSLFWYIFAHVCEMKFFISTLVCIANGSLMYQYTVVVRTYFTSARQCNRCLYFLDHKHSSTGTLYCQQLDHQFENEASFSLKLTIPFQYEQFNARKFMQEIEKCCINGDQLLSFWKSFWPITFQQIQNCHQVLRFFTPVFN